jgi:hypothetical protein
MAEKKKKQTPLQLAAAMMVERRWKNTTKAERSELMRQAALKRKKPYVGGRKRLPDRCYCGKNSRHTAELRSFDCCKRAGLYPGKEAAK